MIIILNYGKSGATIFFFFSFLNCIVSRIFLGVLVDKMSRIACSVRGKKPSLREIVKIHVTFEGKEVFLEENHGDSGLP